MRMHRIVLGALVAVGLFALAGTEANADHRHRRPVFYPPVHIYRPVTPVYVTPFANYGVPTYRYYPSVYNRGTAFSFGYSSGFNNFGPGFYGSPYYGRPGITFGFSTFR